MASFEMVTGPKIEHWLIKTVGTLIVAISLPLLLAAWRRRCPPEVILLALGSALGLTAIDVLYVLRETIPPIYLADAVAEVILIAAWATILCASFSHTADRS
jgi:hypothetical protein